MLDWLEWKTFKWFEGKSSEEKVALRAKITILFAIALPTLFYFIGYFLGAITG